MHFRTSFLIKSFAVALLAGAIGGGSAFAAGVADKAQGGIAGYLVIMGISKLCKFDLDKPLIEATVSNINALQATSKWSDKDIDDALEGVVSQLAKSKDTYCGPGIDVFYSKVKEFEKMAVNEAQGSGVTLKPLPAHAASTAAAPTAANADAVEKLNVAIMLEAVSDECAIKLKDGESLKIDRVEYYWRGKADYSAKQFADLQKFWEDKTKTDHAKVCAKDFGFRPAFEAALKTIG